MYRTKEDTQKRKDEKRKLILDTAAKVFSTKGYHNTTVKDIVKEAQVSVGSFYFYFTSKEDLFAELYNSTVKEFDDITTSVLDVAHAPMTKNFVRVMMATLWMYEQKRELTRFMLLDVIAVEPAFQKLEADRMQRFTQIMTSWFERFQQYEKVNIPDARVAALVYAGSYHSLINDWLISDANTSLTKYGYAFCIYNLQALNISFQESEVKTYIDEVLNDLENSAKN